MNYLLIKLNHFKGDLYSVVIINSNIIMITLTNVVYDDNVRMMTCCIFKELLI